MMPLNKMAGINSHTFPACPGRAPRCGDAGFDGIASGDETDGVRRTALPGLPMAHRCEKPFTQGPGGSSSIGSLGPSMAGRCTSLISVARMGMGNLTIFLRREMFDRVSSMSEKCFRQIHLFIWSLKETK